MIMEPRLAFGRAIHALREKLGQSQSTFGGTIGVSGGTISSWERGKHCITWACYERLADRHPGMRAEAMEELISREAKPGGAPKNPDRGPRPGRLHSPPAFPPVHDRAGKPGPAGAESAEGDPRAESPGAEAPEAECPPPAAPVQEQPEPPPAPGGLPAGDSQPKLEISLSPSALAAFVRCGGTLGSKEVRKTFINALRKCGASDTFILAVIHEVLG